MAGISKMQTHRDKGCPGFRFWDPGTTDAGIYRLRSDHPAPKRGLRRVLAYCSGIHTAYPVMRHLDGKRAFDLAQVVALGGAGKG